MKNKIKIGVSSCLIGEKVRWNGDHKQDRYVSEILGKYFEYITVCPEVEAGMSTPRETVALYGNLEEHRMISKTSKTDWTQKMDHYTTKRINQLKHEELCGYIFKSKSPSCGIARVPVYADSSKSKAKHGAGMFANAFLTAFPLIPVEDEGRLNDSKIRENFIIKVFSFHRLQILLRNNFSLGKLVKFHTQHKFVLLAHSRKHYDALGKLVANGKSLKSNELKLQYSNLFMKTLTYRSTPKKNTDALLHMMGFLKKILTQNEKKDILGVIEDYRKELLPLIVPITLIRHQVKKHNIDYLQEQIYLTPHPKELMLRNHV